MTVTSRITAQAASPEHPANGVERGFVDLQDIVLAAHRLDALAARWPERKLLNVAVLRALLLLVQREPGQAEEGFDAWAIAAAVGTVIGRKWATGDTRDEISAKVRDQWQRLTSQTWPKKEEGIHQHFRDSGLNLVPTLSREEGGGQGNPTRYRFRLQHLPESDAGGTEQDEVGTVASAVSGRAPEQDVPGRDARVTYICEDVEDASWLARSFAQGFQLAGWRRLALRSAFILGILTVALMALLIPLTVVTTRSPGDIANAVFSAVVFGYAFWSTLGTLLMLHRWRIALAPWWMQSVDDDRLVEWRCPPRHADKSIKAVRYAARCPLCGGKVVACSGGMRHSWRIVGRCEEAPAAHVFAFDHVLREGNRLL